MYVPAQKDGACSQTIGTMTLTRSLLWTAGALAAPFVLAFSLLAIFGWNPLRGPIENLALQKTGRVLTIQGDLSVSFGWPWPRIHAKGVSFANPPWTHEKQMVTANAVDLTLDLPQLLQGNIVLPEVHLDHPVVYLEEGPQGKKNWLLDVNQQDEGARVRIRRLTLDQGTLGYDNPLARTHIRAELSSLSAPQTDAADSNGPGVALHATGQYHGLSLAATGRGGPVLALRDESSPYPITVDATVGRTHLKAQGSITGLIQRTALDMRVSVSGDSLEQLYPLLGIAFPATHPYTTHGHLVHHASTWRYDAFSGRIGSSDVAGNVQVTTGAARPMLTAEITSGLLDLGDLGPVIGVAAAHGARAPAPGGAAKPTGVLPDLPFNTERWTSVDADVRLRAKQMRRDHGLPLDDLTVHLNLRDAVLTLDPLDFGAAGGHLRAAIALDGRKHPIQASARVQVQKLLLSKLLPAVPQNQANIGEINGRFTLTGHGDSVGRMLASANGDAALVVTHGEVSQLMMEKAGLHLWEILQLRMGGDRRVALRCAVADFDVKNGVMKAEALVIDTEVTTLMGTGQIDLGHETLDLTFNQKTKNTSPLALRSPIFIRGSFAKPVVGVDKGRVALRALGSVALGVLNPLLALIPLVDLGPGKDSDCAHLVRDAKMQGPARSTPPRGSVAIPVHESAGHG